MKINITINCDNAAFDESPSNEVSRILFDLAQSIKMIDYDIREIDGKKLRDWNGNIVGKVTIDE